MSVGDPFLLQSLGKDTRSHKSKLNKKGIFPTNMSSKNIYRGQSKGPCVTASFWFPLSIASFWFLILI